MAWKVTTAPAKEVWTLNEVKNYLKVDTSADDTLITTLLQSAREVAERYLNQALITQTITEKLDRLNNPTIYLSVSPVINVSLFQYNDGVNSVQTYNAANYVVDTFLKPGRLALAYGSTWPTLYGNINDLKQNLILFFHFLYQILIDSVNITFDVCLNNNSREKSSHSLFI
jgi:uncharacterized phiE125 gp8 family phage protein